MRAAAFLVLFFSRRALRGARGVCPKDSPVVVLRCSEQVQ